MGGDRGDEEEQCGGPLDDSLLANQRSPRRRHEPVEEDDRDRLGRREPDEPAERRAFDRTFGGTLAGAPRGPGGRGPTPPLDFMGHALPELVNPRTERRWNVENVDDITPV